MVKNIIKYIFIYTLLVGCDSNSDPNSILGTCDSNCYLDISAPSLEMDNNGYYHMTFLSDYIQTFATLEARTGSDNSWRKVKWLSNKEMNMGNDEWANVVNKNSYANEEGLAITILGVWGIFVRDTITVYAGYKDKCDIQYVDSLKVVIDG